MSRIKIQAAGDLLFVRTNGADNQFLKDVRGCRWQGTVQAFALRREYAKQMIQSLYEHPGLEEDDLPPDITPEELEEEMAPIINDIVESKALRKGSTGIEVPEFLWRLDEDGEILKPRDYQYECALFSKKMKRAIIGIPVGYGKSLSALVALLLADLANKSNKTKAMIFCPASTKELVWAREVLKWTDLKCVVIEGPADVRHTLYNSTADIYIMNPELIRYDWSYIKDLAVLTCDMLIFDEASIIAKKNDTSKKVTELAESLTYCFYLTGTPVCNNVMELYNLVNVIDPHIFRSESEFKYRYMPRDENGKWITHGVMDPEDLMRAVAPVLYLKSSEELKAQLPKPIAHLEPVELYATQKTQYATVLLEQRKVVKQTMTLSSSGSGYVATGKTGHAVLAAFQKLRQICDHPSTLGLPGDSAKMDRLIELMTGDLGLDKVIIFSQFTKTIPIMQKALKAVGIKHTTLSGLQSRKEKVLAHDQFQEDPECRAIILTTAGGMGINLTKATCVVLFNLLWNPKMMDQIIARAVRFGNKAAFVRVISLLCLGTVEEKILHRASLKAELCDTLMQDASVVALDSIQIKGNVYTDLMDLLMEGEDNEV